MRVKPANSHSGEGRKRENPPNLLDGFTLRTYPLRWLCATSIVQHERLQLGARFIARKGPALRRPGPEPPPRAWNHQSAGEVPRRAATSRRKALYGQRYDAQRGRTGHQAPRAEVRQQATGRAWLAPLIPRERKEVRRPNATAGQACIGQSPGRTQRSEVHGRGRDYSLTNRALSESAPTRAKRLQQHNIARPEAFDFLPQSRWSIDAQSKEAPHSCRRGMR